MNMVHPAEFDKESEQQVANEMNKCFILNMLDQLGLAPCQTLKENEKAIYRAIQEHELSEEQV